MRRRNCFGTTAFHNLCKKMKAGILSVVCCSRWQLFLAVSATQVVKIKKPKSQTHASASDALGLSWSVVNSQGRIVFSSLQVQPGTTLA